MPTVEVEDGALWYEETGTGPPLVCLHGGWQDHRSWAAQVDAFAEQYRVITVDFRGHGCTGPTDAGSYSVDLFVDDLETLLAELDVQHPILAGISMGGMVIQSYLDRHPARARGAVIGGPLQTMPPFELPGITKRAFSPLPLLTGMLHTGGSKATFRALVNSTRVANGGTWLTLDSEVRASSIEALEAVSAAESRKVFRALYEHESPTLSHVSTPLLVVYGDRETALVKQQGDRLAQSVRSGTVREVAESGHLVNQDRPDEFNDVTASFFETLAPLTAAGEMR
jgi:pimeloyl-ACP methyl ester carboxylesterase